MEHETAADKRWFGYAAAVSGAQAAAALLVLDTKGHEMQNRTGGTRSARQEKSAREGE
jgi:hypothetical protein